MDIPSSSIPSSSPLAPTFGKAGENEPINLLTFLQQLHDELTGDPSRGATANMKKSWVVLITTLADETFASFPGAQEIPWTALHEVLKITEMALVVINEATKRVESLYEGPDEFPRKAFVQFFRLCSVMDAWIDVSVPKEDGYPLPVDLLRNSIQASYGLLRSCGGRVASSSTTPPGWQLSRNIIEECLEVCEELLSLTPVTEFPLELVLLEKPQIRLAVRRSPDKERTGIHFIHILSPSQISSLLTMTLEILINALTPPVLSQWYLADIIRRIVELSQRVLDYVLSWSNPTKPFQWARSLTRLGVALTFARPHLTGHEDAVEYMRQRIILNRIEAGLEYTNTHDGDYSRICNAPITIAPLLPPIHSIITVLKTENWGNTGEHLRELGYAYLSQCIPYFDTQTSVLVTTSLNSRPKTTALTKLLDDVHQRVTWLNPIDTDDVEEKLSVPKEYDWRPRLRVVVQAIIDPVALSWMDDDDSLPDDEYLNRAFREIEIRYQNKLLHNPASPGRIALAESLAELPCALIHPEDVECTTTFNKPGISTIPIYLTIANVLCDSMDNEVTPEVHVALFNALTRALRHHTLGAGGGQLEGMAEIIRAGLKHSSRSVRLSAGRSLVELVHIYQRDGNGAWVQTEALFTILYNIFDTADTHIRETALVTVGMIAKFAIPEVLGQAVCCLVAQFGQVNPLLKATSYMQLVTIAKHHKKSPYGLVSPFINQIAPFAIARLCTLPSILNEFCRFISITQNAFMEYTLNRTLPQLCAKGELRVLRAISANVGKSPASLIMSYGHEILAYAFLLPGPGETSKVMSFIISVLKEEVGDRPIDIPNVIHSCILPLLTDLVIATGDDDADRASTATHALKKVERAFQPKRGQRGTSPRNTSTFLKSYMIGIMSQLSDKLQDIQGKQSIQSKKQILQSFGPFFIQIGPAVSGIAPQILATLQTMLTIPQLVDITLKSWYTFLTTLELSDIGPHVGLTSASLVSFWPTFSAQGHRIAQKCLDYLIFEIGSKLGPYLDDIADLSTIPQLTKTNHKLHTLRKGGDPRQKLDKLLERSISDSIAVAAQALSELRSFLFSHYDDFIKGLASGDTFDPVIGHLVSALLSAACRDGEDAEPLRVLAFDCIGVLGAVDPDRFELGTSDTRMIMLSNFHDEAEAVSFALHLIRDVLVGAFRSTSDMKYQEDLAYAIQELLKFCQFSTALVTPGSTNSVSLKVRNRWNSLPKHVLETVTPLLTSKFTLEVRLPTKMEFPLYPLESTYRDWIQSWTTYLISRVSGTRAKTIFQLFRLVVRNRDVGVAHHLLPHLVLNILISGNGEDAENIRQELIAVLQDQVNPHSSSTPDKKLFSAQTVFMLMDHLNKWLRAVRQDIKVRKSESKRNRANQAINESEEQLVKVDSVLSSIELNLMAKAALQCKAYARSLMTFEQQLVVLREARHNELDSHEYYEALHEIYAHLDEPDGMQGVSALILSPSLEHQIRQHESTGRWTSAQSCWELRLQQSPDNLDFHLGLLRCLKNLGHYDTLRTHVKGVLTRNPHWEPALVGFQIESGWMVGDWTEVQALVKAAKTQTPPVLLAEVLLAMRMGNVPETSKALSTARKLLGAPITASGPQGYRRSYDAVLDLHVLHEIKVIHDSLNDMCEEPDGQSLGNIITRLSSRLDSTLPTFRTREPILSMRRTAFALSSSKDDHLQEVIGQSWMASARIARKAGHWQTAYSAVLQAQQSKMQFAFVESAKLLKATGEPLRALQELENSMQLLDIIAVWDERLDLSVEDNNMPVGRTVEEKRLLLTKAKVNVLRARWMNESDRFDVSPVFKAFRAAADVCKDWESGFFHVGQYQDECFKSLTPEDQIDRGTKMNFHTVRFFIYASQFGSKYIYQTIPRLLTIWLDLGESLCDEDTLTRKKYFTMMTTEVAKAIGKTIPMYKWFTAFPQIVSRVDHGDDTVSNLISRLIKKVIQEYPKQALWLFASVVTSTKPSRNERGRSILNRLRAHQQNNVSALVTASLQMTRELLALCDHVVKDDRKAFSMSRDFPRLFRLGCSDLIIPLQESLTANLPPASSSQATHQPFPIDSPTFYKFYDEIDIMHSLAKPRKITIKGSNGQIYMFLGKPKDDLRKDARLMDFNAIINKLLKSNSESRRRQLHIRTYGVVTLNEECGFIQWVPNTIPIRPVLISRYDARGIKSWSNEMQNAFNRIKVAGLKDGKKIFDEEILTLFPPVFHEWFIETFPEPSAWLASRLTYSRTAAVMSMIGFILGLGDRHCENILLDTNTGDVVHVDFNCLFEKGRTLDTPERVPFRLTQNIVDGFGVTGVEGVFRKACEVTMQLLRDNKDCLMNVLDAFVHDPLVEWEDEKRKLERNVPQTSQTPEVDLRLLARNALEPIQNKLKGRYQISLEKPKKEISTSNLVQMLIQEATDGENLAKMYVGWAPWH